jgi:glyceraldehyde 3-phosphate dehydrogenase
MSEQEKMVPVKLGINGLGRIAKLSLWHHVERQFFSELLVNIGREVGMGIQDIAHFVERDSTYGTLQHFLYGYRAGRVIEELNEKEGSMRINGVKTTFLRRHRNPVDIGWRDLGVEVVVDATGVFVDPTAPADDPRGSVRGHLAAGAKKVIVSAPFKIKDKSKDIPSDAIMTVMGINDSDYEPKKHAIVSNASCTTNCLCYMVKPLLDYFGADRILSAAMTTVHAATSSQQVLDHAPKSRTTDLRKTRSAFNNIILTSTGAAKALGLVIPEMKRIAFIAESVRVPVVAGSLIILAVMIQDENIAKPISREKINGIYRRAVEHYPEGYLVYSDAQNVSADIIGLPRAAAVIEGHENHTRTAAVRISMDIAQKAAGVEVTRGQEGKVIEVPITQAVIYGWYDNELGSYTNMLGDRTVSIAELL